MKKTNKLINLLLNYRESLYKIIFLINVNMKVYIIFLIFNWKKQKLNFFYTHEYKSKIELFQS